MWTVLPSRSRFLPVALVTEGSIIRKVVVGRSQRHALRRGAAWATNHGASAVSLPNPNKL